MGLIAFLSQILSYSIVDWGCFIAITFIGTRYGKWLGLVTGQIIIAFAVTCLDLRWLHDQAQLPDWDGAPDQDPAFYMGLGGRIVLINTLLLPVAFYALAIRRRIGTVMP